MENKKAHDSDSRSRNMAAIRGKDTKPEMIVRKWLWAHGYRYRLNHRGLPGRPDVVMRRFRVCIFVNGGFWHGHDVCVESENLISSACCKIPRTNIEFWTAKILRNKERDIDVKRKLNAMGWHCITVWECELKGKSREQTLESLGYTLNKIFLMNNSPRRRYYHVQEDNVAVAAEPQNPDYSPH